MKKFESSFSKEEQTLKVSFLFTPGSQIAGWFDGVEHVQGGIAIDCCCIMWIKSSRLEKSCFLACQKENQTWYIDCF